MNLLMSISNLLGWESMFRDKTYNGISYDWMANVFGTISLILYVIMGVVGAAGAVYAVWLGIQLARADEQGKRDEAKKHLITVLVAIAVTVVLIVFFNEILPLIVNAFFQPIDQGGASKPITPTTVIGLARMALHI